MSTWSSRLACLLLLASTALAAPAAAGIDLTIQNVRESALVTGATVTYLITVQNVGSDPTIATTFVRDTLPAELDYAFGSGGGWSVTASGPVVTGRYFVHLQPGEAASFEITTTVLAGSGATVVNSASVSTNGEADGSNNRATDVGTVLLDEPDMNIVKQHTGTFQQGANATYQISVSNLGAGPAPANNTVVRDTLPAGLTFYNAYGDGWGVLSVSGTVVTVVHDAPIQVGETASFTLEVIVGLPAAPSVTNVAAVFCTGDAYLGNNHAEDFTEVARITDVAIRKRHTGLFAVGLDGLYSLVVTNVGGEETVGSIVVEDALPAGLSYVSMTGVGWEASVAGSMVTAHYDAPLVPGDSAQFTLRVHVSGAAYPYVVNYASVDVFGEQELSNNTTSDVANVLGTPDLTIDKRHTAPFVVGAAGTYRIVLRNVGQATTSAAATVRDTLPDGLSFLSGSGSGWSITESGGVVTATYPSAIVPGDSAAFTLTVLNGPAASPFVTNRARVSVSLDSNPNNDVDADPTDISLVGGGLSIDKRHTNAFAVGVNGTYRIVVRNVSAAPTLGPVTVRDTLPVGLTFLGGVGTGWSVADSSGVVTATNPNVIAGGDSAAFTLTVGVGAAAYPSVTNAASVSVTGDTNTVNHRDVDPTSVEGLDLSIDMHHDIPFAVGLYGTYQIVVRNRSLAPTSGVTTVLDTLPAGLSFVGGSGAGWGFAEAGGVVTATFPGVIGPPGETTFTLTVAVGAAAAPMVVNAASCSTPGDVNAANDRTLDPTTISGLPDLALDKRHVGSFEVGRTGSYLLVVRDVGANPTLAVTTVIDTLPAGLAYSGMFGEGWSATANGNVVTASYSKSIAVGDSSIGNLIVTVGAAAFPAVTNRARVALGGDGNPANDEDSDEAVVTGADLAIDERRTAEFTAGQNGTYTFVVTNIGGAATVGVATVRDTLPAGLLYVSAGGPGWTVSVSGSVVTANHTGNIAPGDSASMSLVVFVGGAAMPAATNRASVSTLVDLDQANNVDVDVATIGDGVLAVPPTSYSLALQAVSPNPLRGNARVTFSLPRRSPVRISVIDVQGREVAIVTDAEQAAGVHALTLDATGWPAGLYFVRLQCAGVEMRRRIAVVR